MKLQNSYQTGLMASCGVVAWLTWVGCVDGQADTVALISFGDDYDDMLMLGFDDTVALIIVMMRFGDHNCDDDDEFW